MCVASTVRYVHVCCQYCMQCVFVLPVLCDMCMCVASTVCSVYVCCQCCVVCSVPLQVATVRGDGSTAV